MNRVAESATRNRIRDFLPTVGMLVSDTDHPADTGANRTKSRIVLYCQSNGTGVERNRRISFRLNIE